MAFKLGSETRDFKTPGKIGPIFSGVLTSLLSLPSLNIIYLYL